MIQRIRIPSKWDIGSYSGPQSGVADFGLGLGPCGKTVVALEILYHVHGVEIRQVCSCNEYKSFVYPWNTITGRIEVTHG